MKERTRASVPQARLFDEEAEEVEIEDAQE